jgi:hypothetical protein
VAVFDGADNPALDHRDQRYRFRVLGRSGEHGVTRIPHDWSLVNEPAGRQRAG